MRIFLLGLLCLTSCASIGPSYEAMDKNVFKQSEIVILRDDHPLFHNGTFWVEIDGQQVCDLHAEAFLVHPTDTGRHTIQSSLFGEIGTAHINIDVRPGQITYVKMVYKSSRTYDAMFFGPVGQEIAELNDTTSGPVLLTQITEIEALGKMREFTYEEKCK